MPISAVLTMPQTTGFMCFSLADGCAILGARTANVETRGETTAPLA
jgi:hypothetical protein